ncbi:hypothetical protein V1517DRAFT_313051 [Lipomyces orientalis]|uniref:Uncharacterized protein n=1 Tax=Lipomyces orientalis TaxID=1233043 RepID=A0ACC3TXQ0_9ASCO
MPRAPRRRKINLTKSDTRAISNPISLPYAADAKVVAPTVETSTQSTVPILSSALPSSPPGRGKRGKDERVIPDSEDEDDALVVLNEEEDGGGDDGDNELSAFLPKTTSTPKTAVLDTEVGIQPQRRLTRSKQSFLSQEVLPDIVLSGNTKECEDDIEPDNRPTGSSQLSMSDPFGFYKIRGIRVTKAVSSSPHPMSSVPSSPVSGSNLRSRPVDSQAVAAEESTSREFDSAGLRSSLSPPSSPLSELGKTPSPAKASIAKLESQTSPDSPIGERQNGVSENATTRVKKSARETKKMGEITTAQLTELLPRPTRHRRRQRTRSLEFDGSADDDGDTDASDDARIKKRRNGARPRPTAKRRGRSNKENHQPIDISKKRGKDPKTTHTKPVLADKNGAIRNGNITEPDEGNDDIESQGDEEDDAEQSPDSEALREMESERLRQKFKEVDGWDLEVESVPVGSDSSFL